MRGRLITIEGVDGAGKSTLATGLEAELRSHGVDVVAVRDPGGVQAAERIRELVKDPSLRIGGRAEALLYAAARAQLVEEAVLPALEAGRWVIVDRFVDSSLAYQGGGRALDTEDIARVNEFGIAGLEPDRTILLEVDHATGRERQGLRLGGADRLEREDQPFFEEVARAYSELAESDPGRIRTVDAREPPGHVLAAAWAAIVDLLPSNP
jgi:dTMP kinase